MMVYGNDDDDTCMSLSAEQPPSVPRPLTYAMEIIAQHGTAAADCMPDIRIDMKRYFGLHSWYKHWRGMGAVKHFVYLDRGLQPRNGLGEEPSTTEFHWRIIDERWWYQCKGDPTCKDGPPVGFHATIEANPIYLSLNSINRKCEDKHCTLDMEMAVCAAQQYWSLVRKTAASDTLVADAEEAASSAITCDDCEHNTTTTGVNLETAVASTIRSTTTATTAAAPKNEGADKQTCLKVYVAGKWDDRREILAKMQDLIDTGDYAVTYVWPLDEAIAMGQAARNEIRGVLKCDIFVAIMDDPNYPYCGTFTELGCALGAGKRCYIVSPKEPPPVHLALKDTPMLEGMESSPHPSSLSDDLRPRSTTPPFYRKNCFYHHPNINHVETWANFQSRLLAIKAETRALDWWNSLADVQAAFLFKRYVCGDTVWLGDGGGWDSDDFTGFADAVDRGGGLPTLMFVHELLGEPPPMMRQRDVQKGV